MSKMLAVFLGAFLMVPAVFAQDASRLKVDEMLPVKLDKADLDELDVLERQAEEAQARITAKREAIAAKYKAVMPERPISPSGLLFVSCREGYYQLEWRSDWLLIWRRERDSCGETFNGRPW